MHFIDQHCAQNLDYNAQATDPGQLSACPAVDDMQTTQSCEGEVAVARTLLRKGPCVLAFYSSGCGLCHSLKEAINNEVNNSVVSTKQSCVILSSATELVRFGHRAKGVMKPSLSLM